MPDCYQIRTEFGIIIIYSPDQPTSPLNEEKLYSTLVECLLTKPVQETFTEITETKKAAEKRTTEILV